MKFKEGQKVRVKRNLKKIEKFRGGFVPEMEYLEGEIVTIKHVYSDGNISIKNSCFTWDERAFETLTISKAELSKMPIGSKMTIDTGICNEFIKVGEDRWRNGNADFLYDSDISGDLKVKNRMFCINGTKILKVEEPTYTTVYSREDEIKEMTVTEIEKELGYSIKIIKEDK